jgi:ElaB/YqjD/DUF883 family membrane-anchored ribosome-binding protein
MAANSNGPRNLSEAIDRLEKATQTKSEEMKDILGQDYAKIRKALDDLKPHLADITEKVTDQVDIAKKKVETQVQENPLTTLAVAGLAGIIIGWLLGNRKGN